MVRRVAVDGDLEAAVGEGQVLGARDHVGVHARRRIDGGDDAAGLAQASGDVAAAGRDVDCHEAGAGLAQLDHAVEVGAPGVRDAGAVGLGAGIPLGAGSHRDSSTALRAASSIVGWT